MGDSHMGLQARLMSQALRQADRRDRRARRRRSSSSTSCAKKSGSCSQPRDDKPVARRSSSNASFVLDIRRIAPVKEKEEVIGCTCASRS